MKWMYFLSFFAGASIGSFLNVCIYRLPRGMSIVFSRSFCLSCGKVLKWYDLLPIISYILLKGRCRYCKSKISVRYPLIEIATGVWFVLSLYIFGFNLRFLQSATFFCFIVVTSIIDLELMIVINDIVLTGIATGSIIFFMINGISYKSTIDLALGIGIGWGLISLIRLVSKGGMGDGDPYIAMMVAAFMGFKLSILTLLLSFVMGGFTGAILLATEKKGRKDALPFGPFLGIAAIFSYLYGNLIIRWYINLFSP